MLILDKRYTDAPIVKNWYGKINKDNVSIERSYLLQKNELFMIEHNPKVIFTDIVMFPFFLVSNTCKKVISIYSPNTKYKQIVLLDSKAGKAQSYHMPILPKVAEIEAENKGYMGMTIRDEVPQLRLQDIGDNKIFQVEKLGKTYTIVGLDVLESFLRRGTKGIDAYKIEIER